MSIAAAILGGGLIQGVSSIIGAKTAAGAQQAGLNKAIKLQTKILRKQRNLVEPYLDLGRKAAKQFGRQLPDLTAPVDLSPLSMTQQDLEATPGYQFTLGQGLKSVKNELIAKGQGGASGALVKGAETYAAGLADKTFQERWSNALQRIELAFKNKGLAIGALQDIIGTGSGAGTGVAGALGQTGGGIAQSLAGIGQARAGADIATGQAVGNFGNSLISSVLTPKIFGNDREAQTGTYDAGTAHTR